PPMDPERPEDDPVVGFLVRRYARGGPVGPCPEEYLLAAIGRGGLLPEEREGLVEHLAGCERCRGVVALLAKAAPAAVLRAPPRRGVLRLPVPAWASGGRGKPGVGRTAIEIRLPVAAAALLLALVGAFFGLRVLTRSPGIDDRSALGTAENPLGPG